MSVGATIWERRPRTLRKRQLGKSIIYCERYWSGSEWRYYVEASGPDYRIWQRVPRNEERALELYSTYCFWVWLIEACNSMTVTRLLTWIMHRIL